MGELTKRTKEDIIQESLLQGATKKIYFSQIIHYHSNVATCLVQHEIPCMYMKSNQFLQTSFSSRSNTINIGQQNHLSPGKIGDKVKSSARIAPAAHMSVHSLLVNM